MRVKSLVITLAVLVAGVLTTSVISAGPAEAAVPLAGFPFSGHSAHDRYSIELSPQCTSANQYGYGCDQASTLQVGLTAVPAPGRTCPTEYNYSFASVLRIHPNGSFSGTETFNAETSYVTLSVAGTFVTEDSVRGNIIGNDGCGTDSFAIAIPPPLTAVSPCTALLKVHAVRTMAGGLPSLVSENSFDGTGGTCGVQIGSSGGNTSEGVVLTVASSRSRETPMYTQKAPLAGLGAAAEIYTDLSAAGGTVADGNTNYLAVTIVFRARAAWVSWEFEIGYDTCSRKVGCISKYAQTVDADHMVALAHQIDALLR